MRGTLLCLALLSTPAMAQERYVFTQYRAAGAPPHFISSFDTRAACDDMRSSTMRDTEVALEAARRALEQARQSVPAGTEARRRTLAAERETLQAAVRGSRRERLVTERLSEVNRELEMLRNAEDALRAAGDEVQQVMLTERALRESSICERR